MCFLISLGTSVMSVKYVFVFGFGVVVIVVVAVVVAVVVVIFPLAQHCHTFTFCWRLLLFFEQQKAWHNVAVVAHGFLVIVVM